MRVDGKCCRGISYEQVDVDMYIIFYKHCAAFHVSLGLYAYHWISFSSFHLNHIFLCFLFVSFCLVLTLAMRYMDLQTRVGN